MELGEALNDAVEKEESGGTKTPTQLQKKWGKEVKAAQKRTRKWRKTGERVTERYLGETATSEDVGRDDTGWRAYQLNLFHSTTKTVQSMLYGSVPKVEVGREFHDPDDDMARVAAMLYQRILQADVDPSGDGLATALKAALQDRLLPGLGIARVRYAVKTHQEPVMDPLTNSPMINEDGEPVLQEVLDYEEAPVDYIHWDDFLWGWGRTWAEIDWVGFRSYLNKEQVKARFGEEWAKKLNYKHIEPDEDEETKTGQDKDQQSVDQKAEIWEVWCKSERKCYWIQLSQDEIIEEKDDPLRLDGFFPVPKPMVANQTTKMFIPRADFKIAEDIYNQCDELYTRITIITRAVKVVGVYDKAADTSVGRMMKEGMENDMIPVDNWAMFAEGGGVRGKIDWFPVQDVVGVLQTLRSVLTEQIELLGRVTGMADIMRGQIQQYAGNQQTADSAKFGSVRVQALQEEFARFASDLEELRAEVISKHFEDQSILEQSGSRFLSQADQKLVPQAVQLMKSPEIKWRVNIRPESIAMVDYQQVQNERTQFMMAIAQFIQSGQAMAAADPTSMPYLLELLKWGMAGFKGANELEGIMDQAIKNAMQNIQKQQQQQEQQKNQPSPEQIKAQTEQMRAQTAQMKAQADLQKVQAKAQADMQTIQAKLQARIQELQTDAQNDQTISELEHRQRMTEIMQEFQNDMRLIADNLQADLLVEQTQAEFDVAAQEVEHRNDMAQIAAQTLVRGV